MAIPRNTRRRLQKTPQGRDALKILAEEGEKPCPICARRFKLHTQPELAECVRIEKERA